MMSAKLLLWSLVVFLAFGALAFLAVVAAVITAIRDYRRRRRAEVVFAMDPVRRIRR